MDVTVRRVRPDEGAALKAVRLAALADAPSAFGSSYAAEVDVSEDDWTMRAARGAAGTSSVTYLAVVGHSVVGPLPSDPCRDEVRMRRRIREHPAMPNGAPTRPRS